MRITFSHVSRVVSRGGIPTYEGEDVTILGAGAMTYSWVSLKTSSMVVVPSSTLSAPS